MNAIRRILAHSAAVLLAAAASAGEWDTNLVVMHVDKGNFPPGSRQTYMNQVESIFNRNPSNFRFDLRYDLNNGAGRIDNGRSEIFSSGAETAPMATYTCYDWWSGDIVEADIRVGSDSRFWWSWSYSYTKTNHIAFGGIGRPVEATMLHELGHAAGLGHESDVYNIMGDDWTHMHCNGTTARGYLGEDASNALIARYGRNAASSIEDVSVSGFKWTGRSGEYSTHGPCDVRNPDGTVRTWNWDSTEGQRRYNLARGGYYFFEFTYENNGENNKTAHIGFYVSTDSTINSADTYIGGVNRTFGRGDDQLDTTSFLLRVPSDLVRGQKYYVGAIVDDDNRIGEIDGQNAAYHVIRIQ